jgi:hypothetical protein
VLAIASELAIAPFDGVRLARFGGAVNGGVIGWEGGCSIGGVGG